MSRAENCINSMKDVAQAFLNLGQEYESAYKTLADHLDEQAEFCISVIESSKPKDHNIDRHDADHILRMISLDCGTFEDELNHACLNRLISSIKRHFPNKCQILVKLLSMCAGLLSDLQNEGDDDNYPNCG